MIKTVNRHQLHLIIIYITVACWATVMFLFLPACSGKHKKFADAINKEDTLASMETLGVTTYISDSGLIRYKIVAEKWDIFDKKNPSFWAFERGVYLEKFDTLFHIDASIKADTAYYFDKKKLWELRGDVHIQNLQGDKFETELLYWDEKTQRIYSDKHIHIEQADQGEIDGYYGFEANQQLTEYTIYNNSGIFNVNNTGTAQAQPVRTDSVNTEEAVQSVPSRSMARRSERTDYNTELSNRRESIKADTIRLKREQ